MRQSYFPLKHKEDINLSPIVKLQDAGLSTFTMMVNVDGQRHQCLHFLMYDTHIPCPRVHMGVLPKCSVKFTTSICQTKWILISVFSARFQFFSLKVLHYLWNCTCPYEILGQPRFVSLFSKCHLPHAGVISGTANTVNKTDRSKQKQTKHPYKVYILMRDRENGQNIW